MIHLNDNPCSTEGIEIHFIEMKKIVLVNSKEKSNMFTSPILTLPDGYARQLYYEPIWISFHKGIVYIIRRFI